MYKDETTIHPGRKCGPCQLCCKSASYYIHLSTWDPELSTKLPSQTPFPCLWYYDPNHESFFAKGNRELRELATRLDWEGIGRV